MNEARDRCAAFVADIVEVCKKHRVMMRLDEDEIESPVFEEYPPRESNGVGFILETEALEDAIRNAVWDVVHQSEEITDGASTPPVVILPRWRRVLESPITLYKHYKIARQYAGVFNSIRIAWIFWKITVRRYE